MYDSNSGQHSTHGTTTYTSGEAGSVRTLINLRDEQSLSISDYVVTFSDSGTNSATVTLYDDEDGTAPANLDNPAAKLTVSSGDSIVAESVTREVVEEDLLVEVEENDSIVTVTVGAHILTG